MCQKYKGFSKFIKDKFVRCAFQLFHLKQKFKLKSSQMIKLFLDVIINTLFPFLIPTCYIPIPNTKLSTSSTIFNITDQLVTHHLPGYSPTFSVSIAKTSLSPSSGLAAQAELALFLLNHFSVNVDQVS